MESLRRMQPSAYGRRMSPPPERLLPNTYHELLDLLPDEAGMSI